MINRDYYSSEALVTKEYASIGQLHPKLKCYQWDMGTNIGSTVPTKSRKLVNLHTLMVRRFNVLLRLR